MIYHILTEKVICIPNIYLKKLYIYIYKKKGLKWEGGHTLHACEHIEGSCTKNQYTYYACWD